MRLLGLSIRELSADPPEWPRDEGKAEARSVDACSVPNGTMIGSLTGFNEHKY